MKNVYIDFANFNSECRLQNIKVDFARFHVFLKNKYNPDHIYIFTGFLEKNKSKYAEMENFGFEYIFKEVVFNKMHGLIKANVDIDIAIKGVFDTTKNSLKESVIITSDGDYASLVKFWRDNGVAVKIISPSSKARCSYLLRKGEKSLVYLEQIVNHFIKEKDLDMHEVI